MGNRRFLTIVDVTWQFTNMIIRYQLLLTMFSPWQWFFSTRTFSNSLETTLTIAALYYWPWELTLDPVSLTSDSIGETTTPAKIEIKTLPKIFDAPQSLTQCVSVLYISIMVPG
jgi:hypothetical protein